MKRCGGFVFSCFVLLALCLQFCVGVAAQEKTGAQAVTSLKAADARYKADILVVVAHPDDEGAATPYLARAIDGGKRVAVVYGTRGSSGANEVGAEQAAALARFAKLKRDARWRCWGSPTCGFWTGKIPLRRMCCNRFRIGSMAKRCSSWCG